MFTTKNERERERERERESAIGQHYFIIEMERRTACYTHQRASLRMFPFFWRCAEKNKALYPAPR